MIKQVIEEVRRLLVDATCDTLAAYDIDVEVQDCAPKSPNYVATMGFSGEGVSGALSLTTTTGAAMALCQRTPGVVGLADWLGELTNQLMGRLQSKLLRRGLSLSAGVPVVVQGGTLSVVDDGTRGPMSRNRARLCVEQPFMLDGDELAVRLSLDVPHTFALLSEAPLSSSVPAHGEPMLF